MGSDEEHTELHKRNRERLEAENDNEDAKRIIENSRKAKLKKEIKEAEERATVKPVIYNEVDSKIWRKMKLGKNEMQVLLWVFAGGLEDAFISLSVKKDAQKFEYKGKEYIIDRNKIQNRLGVVTYNHEINNATGGLSFIKPSWYKVDAKNYADAVKREHYTALWGKWKIPFIIMAISMGVALVMGLLAMVGFFGQQDIQEELDDANLCLADIPCMEGKIATIKSQIEQAGETPDDPNAPAKPPVGGNR